MENIFYIPINSSSLAHYFSKAIILPSKYFTNKPEDIQNTVGDSILVSERKWVKNSDCTLEVVLTAAEIKELIQVSDNFSLSNTPIPISRIKSICFLDLKQKETTIWNINSGAAFVPENLVAVDNNDNIEFIAVDVLKPENQNNSMNDVSDKIKRYDIILGGFAFMRLGGKSFMNYSTNYFATLSHFNKLIEEQTNSAAKGRDLKFSNKYIGLFSKHEKSEWTKWFQYIYQNLEPQDIEILAENEGERIEKKLGLLKIDSINPDSHLYELAILATYGDRKNKSTDNLVTDLTNGTIHSEKVEDVSILFGLNNGYSKFRNKYKGAAKDTNVKFTLDSKLDYYIIESIFQFAFYGTKANYSFDYIDKWCPLSRNGDSVKGYETYKILDTTVIAKKKQTPLEVFLENYSASIYSAIVKSISQWLPPFAKHDEKEAIQYFEKKLNSVLTTSIEALQQKIESEYESQKIESVELHMTEVNKLRIEISNLKEENERLKKDAKTTTVAERPMEPLQNEDKAENESIKENSESLSTVQEPVVEVPVNYESMNLQELKKIAKAKKVKGYTKIENKEDLIRLIKNAPPTLL
jgi:hypothetical protein